MSTIPLPDWVTPEARHLIAAVSRMEHQPPREPICPICGKPVTAIDIAEGDVTDETETGVVAHDTCYREGDQCCRCQRWFKAEDLDYGPGVEVAPGEYATHDPLCVTCLDRLIDEAGELEDMARR